ncbi:MAG: hypothetical protein ACI83W_001395 [Marinoscillum sp.]|jgi:hypothetical protein
MKKLTIILSFLFIAQNAISQDLGEILKGGADNGNQILQNYMEPVFVGLGYSFNSGWYNTGKPHKLLGFDLTVVASGSIVPEDAQFYTFNPADYDNMGLAAPENPNSPYTNQMPTIGGPNLPADDIPYFVFNTDDEANKIRVSAPTGLGLDEAIGFNAVPAVGVQLGIGLIKNTELKLRLFPKTTFGDPGESITASQFGLGVMHDVKQWIPGMKNLPFDLSGFFAFSQQSVSAEIGEDSNGDPQSVNLDISGTTMQAIISKKLAILTVYGGIGFSTVGSSFAMKGDYEIDGVDPDPINFDYNTGSLRANIGARLKLLIFTFHAEYAVQEYNTLTAGFGLSIR